MRRALLFMLLGCSGAPASRPPPVPPPPPAPVPVDAARPRMEPGGFTPTGGVDAPPPTARGGACRDGQCVGDMVCAPEPQGYCLSGCDACADGACVDTWKDGARCLAPCMADRACRVDEGYVCDASWHACMLPNSAAIIPRMCTAAPHDASFAVPQPLTTAHAIDPTAAIAPDGSLVALFALDDLAIGGALPLVGTEPRLVRMPSGQIDALWNGRAGIQMAMSPDGHTWTEAKLGVQDPADDSPFGEPIIAPGYALYSSHDTLRIRPLASDHAVTPMAGARGNAVVGSDRRLHVVTINGGPLGGYGSADQRIEYTVSRDGGHSFAKPLAISERDEELPWFFAAPAIAIDDRRGWLYIAYVRGGRDARWDLVVVAMHDRGASPAGEKIVKRAVIGDDCSIHMSPSLALDPTTGTLHVAYYDSSGFAHAVCSPGSCKVAGSIATFAVSTARSGPRALGDRAALVIDDKRRTLHAVWSQPGGVFHAVGTLQGTAKR